LISLFSPDSLSLSLSVSWLDEKRKNPKKEEKNEEKKKREMSGEGEGYPDKGEREKGEKGWGAMCHHGVG
jgi:hypothetical protein